MWYYPHINDSHWKTSYYEQSLSSQKQTLTSSMIPLLGITQLDPKLNE